MVLSRFSSLAWPHHRWQIILLLVFIFKIQNGLGKYSQIQVFLTRKLDKRNKFRKKSDLKVMLCVVIPMKARGSPLKNQWIDRASTSRTSIRRRASSFDFESVSQGRRRREIASSEEKYRRDNRTGCLGRG